MWEKARVVGVVTLSALSLIVLGPLLPTTTPLAEILLRGLGIQAQTDGSSTRTPADTGFRPVGSEGVPGVETPVGTPTGAETGGINPLFDFSSTAGVSLGGSGVPVVAAALVGVVVGLLVLKQIGVVRLVAIVGVIAAEFGSLLLVAPGTVFRMVAAKLRPTAAPADDEAPEESLPTGAPAAAALGHEAELDSAAGTTVADAWAQLATRVEATRGASTEAVAQRAIKAGFPAPAVKTIRDAYRDVRYGHKQAESRVQKVQTAADQLEQPVNTDEDEQS